VIQDPVRSSVPAPGEAQDEPFSSLLGQAVARAKEDPDRLDTKGQWVSKLLELTRRAHETDDGERRQALLDAREIAVWGADDLEFRGIRDWQVTDPDLFYQVVRTLEFADNWAERQKLLKRANAGETIYLGSTEHEAYGRVYQYEVSALDGTRRVRVFGRRPEYYDLQDFNLAGKMGQLSPTDLAQEEVAQSREELREARGFALKDESEEQFLYDQPNATGGSVFEKKEEFLERALDKTGKFLARAAPVPGADEMLLDAEESLHNLGFEPGPGAQNIIRDGKIQSGVFTERDEPFISFLGEPPSGFKIDSKLRDTIAFVFDPAAIRKADILQAPLVTDEATGRRSVVIGDEEIPIPNLSLGGQLKIPLPDGEVVELNLDDELISEIRGRQDGGLLGHTVVGAYFHLGGKGLDALPEMIETPYGPMLLPNLTGNPSLDRQIMQQPEFLRAYVEEAGPPGFWRKLIQTTVMMTEFIPIAKAGSFALRGLGKVGSFGIRTVGRGKGIGAYVTEMGGALGKGAMEGARRSKVPARPFRFDMWNIPEFAWYEVVNDAVRGHFDPAASIHRGASNAISLVAFGKGVRSARYTAGWMARTKFGETVAAIGSGRVSAALTKSRDFYMKYDAGAPEMQGLVAAAQRALKSQSDVRAAVAAHADRYFAGKIQREFVGQLIDTSFVGLMFGSYEGALVLAAERGIEFDPFTDPGGAAELMAEAFAKPETLATALAFVSVQAGHYHHQRNGGARAMLSPEMQRAMSEILESVVAATELQIPIAGEAWAHTYLRMSELEVSKHISESRADDVGDWLGGDVPGVALSKMPISDVLEIYRHAAGPDRLRHAFQHLDEHVLLELAAQSQNLTIEGGRAEAGGAVYELLKGELERRAEGGRQADYRLRQEQLAWDAGLIEGLVRELERAPKPEPAPGEPAKPGARPERQEQQALPFEMPLDRLQAEIASRIEMLRQLPAAPEITERIAGLEEASDRIAKRAQTARPALIPYEDIRTQLGLPEATEAQRDLLSQLAREAKRQPETGRVRFTKTPPEAEPRSSPEAETLARAIEASQTARENALRAEAVKRAQKFRKQAAAREAWQERINRLQRAEGDIDLETFVRAHGGLRGDEDVSGELRRLTEREGGKKHFGLPPVVHPRGSPKGIPWEVAKNLAAGRGWFPGRDPADITFDQFYDALARQLRKPEEIEASAEGESKRRQTDLEAQYADYVAEYGEPKFEDGANVPTGKDLADALAEVYRLLRDHPDNLGKSPEEIIQESLSAYDMAEGALLDRAVAAAREKAKEVAAPPPEGPSIERPETADALDADLVHGLERAGGPAKSVQDTLTRPERVRQTPGVPEQPAPVPARSVLWAEGDRATAFGAGREAFRASGHHALADAVVNAYIHSLRAAELRANGQTAEAAVHTDLLESITAGLLAATGLQPTTKRSTGSWESLIAALTNQSVKDVETVRDRMFVDAAGLSKQAQREARSALGPNGVRLLTAGQMGRSDTRRLLSLIALDPPGEARRGASNPPNPAAAEILKQEGYIRIVDDPAYQEAFLSGIPRIKTELLKAQGLELRDLRGQLMSRVATAVLGRAKSRAGAETVVPKAGKTLGFLTDLLYERVSGRRPELRSRGKREAFRIGEQGGIVENAQRAAEQAGRQATAAEAYILHARAGRRAWSALEALTVFNWQTGGFDPLLPEGSRLDSPQSYGTEAPRNLMRRLYLEDPWLLERFRESLNPDGSPVFENPDLAFEQAVKAAKTAADFAQHQMRESAREVGGDSAAVFVQAIIDARGAMAADKPIPDEVLRVLGDPTAFPELFPSGALRHIKTETGEAIILGEFVEHNLAVWFHRQLDLETRGALAEVARDNDIVEMWSTPLPAMFGWALGKAFPAPPRYPLIGGQGKLTLRRLTTWMGEEGSWWQRGRQRRRLTEAMNKALFLPWLTKYLANKGSIAPDRVSEASLTARRILVGEKEMEQRMMQETADILRRVALKHHSLTAVEAQFLGKAIAGKAWLKIRDVEHWRQAFPGAPDHLFGVMNEIVLLFNQLGKRGVHANLFTQEQYMARMGHYLPRWVNSPLSRESIVARQQAGLSAFRVETWQHHRENEDVIDALQHMYDVRYVVPMRVWQEASSIRGANSLARLAESLALVPSSEHAAMTPFQRAFLDKAQEPLGGKLATGVRVYDANGKLTHIEGLTAAESARVVAGKMSEADADLIVARRRKANENQTRLYDMIEGYKASAARGDVTIGPRLQRAFDLLEDGYIPKELGKELSILADQMDPTLNLSDPVQRLTLYWRRLRTVQNPKHWFLNFTTSIATNHLTGKVSFLDFLKGVALGKGHYFESFGATLEYVKWDRAGRGELPTDPQARYRVLVMDAIVRELGSSTLVSTAFGEGAADMLSSMMRPSRTDLGGREPPGSTGQEFLESIGMGQLRAGRSVQSLDQNIAALFGSAEPAAHAEAIMAQQTMYQATEVALKGAAVFRGLEAGMTLREAVEWGAEGTGDYSRVNPHIREWTTQFGSGVSSPSRLRALELLGKGEAGARRHAQLTGLVRMGLASPFWMYRASMWPTLSGALIDNPVNFLVGMGLINLGFKSVGAVFGDEEDRFEARTGHGHMANERISPEAEVVLRENLKNLRLASPVNGAMPASARVKGMDWMRQWKLWWSTGGRQGTAAFTTVGPKKHGRSTFIPMAEFMGADHPLFPAGISRLRQLGEEGPRDTEKTASDVGIGFLPFAMIQTLMEWSELARGEAGKTRAQSVSEAVLDFARTWSSPSGGGLGTLPSSLGQRGVLEIGFGGRSWNEVWGGVSRSPKVMGGLLERLGGLAVEQVLPVRQVSSYSTVPDRRNFGERMLSFVGQDALPPALSTDEKEAIAARAGRTIKGAAVTWFGDGYEEHLQGLTPLMAIYQRYFDLPANVVGDKQRGYVLDPEQAPKRGEPDRRSALAQLIARQPASEQRAWIDVALGQLEASSEDMERLFLSLALKRELDPAIADRLASAVWSRNADPSDLLKVMWEKVAGPDPDRDRLSMWSAIWDRLVFDLDADRLGSKNQGRMREIEAALEGVAPSEVTSFTEVFGPQVFDVAPFEAVEERATKQALPTYDQLLGGDR